MALKLIIGLGNPGREYERTRHNAGFMVLDEIARRRGLEFSSGHSDAWTVRLRGEDGAPLAILAKPSTFMNLSGRAVSGLRGFYKIDVPEILIITDDVNLPLGRLRARARGSEGGHNGLRSVAEQLGTLEYPRLRVGVGRGDVRRDLADHVLAGFDADEQEDVNRAIERAADAADVFIADGIVKVMNTFNTGESGQTPDSHK
ncbi:MAG TPA: aminoacyl-tRNA hydrolase [Vicinamibacterales bacterium]|nr:aminoacyl-tRNA hydrolase [Vicinamibacterales bacterium]